jgi:hypothetical protein
VANQRVHGTTHEQVMVRWDVEQFSLQLLAGRPPFPYVDGELRKVARDVYVDWQGSRYSVPWQYAGQDVWVQEIAEEVDIRTGREPIAMHGKAQRKYSVLTFPPHHQGIPLGARRAESKILIHLRQSTPEVEKRSLAGSTSGFADLFAGQLLDDDGEYHRDASTRDRRRNLPLRNRGCHDDKKQIRFRHVRADRVKADWGRLLCGQGGRTNEAVDGAEGERVVRAAAVAGWKQLRAGIGDQSAGDVAGGDVRSRGD